MTTVVIAEKPSVARSIADVLGATQNGPGCRRGNGYVVSWAIGHLVGLAEPHEMNPDWKAWRFDQLPMLPRQWQLKVLEQTKDHFSVLSRLLNAPEIEHVICATDAGREGELIFRYIYRLARCQKPVTRLWISSLTPEAIRAGFRKLRPASEFDRLAAAAEARSRADWLVGMNLSRAYTLRFGPDLLSVGRVQTPTLAMLVDREKTIRDFVPEKYCEVEASFGKNQDSYSGVWFDPAKKEEDTSRRLPPDGVLAEAIRARCAGQRGQVVEVTGKDNKFPPPFLYDLTELQRHANRLYGMTAQATLTTAQSLYERHKLISYPRTDSRYLSESVSASLGPVVAAIAPRYRDALAPGTASAPLTKRYVDDTKITDHHAIIPTDVSAAGKRLSQDEERIYDLVCRRLLMAWHAEYKTRTTKVLTRVPAEADRDADVDWFRSSGTLVTQLGWKVLDIEPRKSKKTGEPSERRLPDGLAVGQARPVTAIEVQHKQTSPPPRFTDATLLTAMESAGRALDNRELEEAMRERGLGTPATRAAILETLLVRKYVERQGKSLHVTDRGIALIEVVHEAVKSPQLTGEWELSLKKLERGEGSFGSLMNDIEQFVAKVVAIVREGAGALPPALPPSAALSPLVRASASAPARRPTRVDREPSTETAIEPAAEGLLGILRQRFGHASFRPHQEEVCRAAAAGEDALLVMPTGSGKSLCYQVPGIARGGCTLVVSPLIALMEDQTAKLTSLGFRAAAIHSGRGREHARAACRAYLDGVLDFLMIAPERLAVPGFPEMLARRKPALIAIDEAHCISHWGHDFRPDYRLLGGRLPLLRPSPILALTATATVRVQDDILVQLGIPEARRFVHGFRRENLAISVLERPWGEAFVQATLAPAERRPAIVYVPSRKWAEDIALELVNERFRAASYHAGLDSYTRSATQNAFQQGGIDVVVATVAFGMGIDKADIRTVVHVALPSSIEGYYQEIGRAGRDGRPAAAILFYSYGDRNLQEALFERDYPATSALQALLSKVPPDGIERAQLQSTSGLELANAEAAIGKLWVHGAVTVDAEDVVRPGSSGWLRSYEAIRAYRHAQIDEVLRFVKAGTCRMVQLVRHFGEAKDLEPCGTCDNCRAKDRLRSIGAKPRKRRTAEKPKAKSKRKPKTKAPAPSRPVDSPVAMRLREWRQRVAKKLDVPVFVVMRDEVLSAVVEARPTTPAELARVPGVGPTLIEKYGAVILRMLRY